MPRMPEAEKRKSHERILESAADLFREQGIENTSVSEVMKAAGMTHGGFYRHFSDKDDLVAGAFSRAVDDVVREMEGSKTEDAKAAARAAYVETYLSMDHVNNRRKGCPMAALASELVRIDGRTAGLTSEAVDRVASLLQGGGNVREGYAHLAVLVGAVTLARMVHNDGQSRSILDAAEAAIDQLSSPRSISIRK